MHRSRVNSNYRIHGSRSQLVLGDINKQAVDNVPAAAVASKDCKKLKSPAAQRRCTMNINGNVKVKLDLGFVGERPRRACWRGPPTLFSFADNSKDANPVIAASEEDLQKLKDEEVTGPRAVCAMQCSCDLTGGGARACQGGPRRGRAQSPQEAGCNGHANALSPSRASWLLGRRTLRRWRRRLRL
jgi:hypothetical protein